MNKKSREEDKAATVKIKGQNKKKFTGFKDNSKPREDTAVERYDNEDSSPNMFKLYKINIRIRIPFVN